MVHNVLKTMRRISIITWAMVAVILTSFFIATSIYTIVISRRTERVVPAEAQLWEAVRESVFANTPAQKHQIYVELCDIHIPYAKVSKMAKIACERLKK